MLKQRILTSILLVPPVIAGLILMPNVAVASGLGLVSLAAAWEWSALAGWLSAGVRTAYVAVTGVAMLIGYAFLGQGTTDTSLLMLAMGWWLVAFVSVIGYQLWDLQLPRSPALRGVAGGFVLLPSWAALVVLHDSPNGGPNWVIFLLALVWVADIAAYFVGRRFGKHRLAAKVSPGKTWEGVLGSFVGIFLVALVGTRMILPTEAVFLPFFVLCFVTGIVSIVGDLVESQFKRTAGVKDSGTLLPGHGGVLDRIDSLSAAAPTFVLGATLLGIRP